MTVNTYEMNYTEIIDKLREENYRLKDALYAQKDECYALKDEIYRLKNEIGELRGQKVSVNTTDISPSIIHEPDNHYSEVSPAVNIGSHTAVTRPKKERNYGHGASGNGARPMIPKI